MLKSYSLSKEEIANLVLSKPLIEYDDLPPIMKESLFINFEKAFCISTFDDEYFNRAEIAIYKTLIDKLPNTYHFVISTIDDTVTIRDKYKHFIFSIGDRITRHLLDYIAYIDNGVISTHHGYDLSKCNIHFRLWKGDNISDKIVDIRKLDFSGSNIKPYLGYLEYLTTIHNKGN